MKVLILLGHPNNESFNASIAEHYQIGAVEAGHDVKFVSVSQLTFDPLNQSTTPVLESDLLSVQRMITWAEHIVCVYPIWWGSMPALMKGFFDRVLTPGFAFKYQDKSMPLKLLEGRTVELVSTTDTPSWLQWFLLKGDVLQQKRNVWSVCGIKLVKVTRFGPVYNSEESQRQKWLQDALAVGRNA